MMDARMPCLTSSSRTPKEASCSLRHMRSQRQDTSTPASSVKRLCHVRGTAGEGKASRMGRMGPETLAGFMICWTILGSVSMLYSCSVEVDARNQMVLSLDRCCYYQLVL